ncbi:hypothetical protein CPB85DRAFT_1374706 [Mucidula mucida]|nr:hypothetical protein CPB85DRAFT_1374706 [Mucidula mucida]
MPDCDMVQSLTTASTFNGSGTALPGFLAPSDSAYPPAEGFNPNAPVLPVNGTGDLPASDPVLSSPSPEVDPQILEALRSKDRIYVLKLGEQMESLITERRFRIDLSPSTSYQRLLVHRCSQYYKLLPEPDPVSKGIIVSTTSDSRIPPRRLADLVPAESIAPPAFQIMRRSSQNRRQKPHSQAGSVTGDDGDLSDVEPSEAGSIGGRSNATGGSSKKRMTIEEREAAYNEARSRIFMDFEEKEKEKEKDMSSSSSLSVISGSASTSGSVGDIEDSASSVATESEWSAPSFKKGRSNASTRSVRSSVPPYSSNGAGSSRNSRAPSPSFTYASLYEPNASALPYDATHPHMPVSAPGYQPTHYFYPYGPPGQPPNPGYLAPYAPYYPYPYGPPPPPQQNPSDPSSPANGEMFAPHPMYHTPYPWAPPNQQPPPPPPHHVISPVAPSENGAPPPNQNSPPYHPYMPQMYMYPAIHGYYPPPPPPGQPVLHGPPPHPPMLYDPNSPDGIFEGMEHNGGRSAYNAHRLPRTATFTTSNGKGNRSNAPQPRHAWSYGPGVSGGGLHGVNGIGDLGPRFSNNRRPSNHSSGSSSGNHRSSNWDEVSSTASSSTTSSSSRRTYTSTSSQHPLPARPDWAVGLKPDPTLHATNRHHDSHNSRSPISPSRNGSSTHSLPSTRRPPINPSLQPNDFPPLSSLSPTEKRAPVVAGAWTNPPATRSLMNGGQGNALVHHSNSNGHMNRLEEVDRFERPPPRAAELYNPKLAKRSASNNSAKQQEKEDNRRGRPGLVD